MTSVAAPVPRAVPGVTRTVTRALTRVIAALRSRAGANRTMLALVLLYGLSWALYGTVTKLGEYLQGDMTEVFAWSLGPPQLGHKHPPFLTWVVKAWFAVWPVAPWAYYLLAGTSLAVTLYCVWLMAGHYVDRRRQVLATVLLGLNPVYGPLALDFNHNIALLPLWAACGLAFTWSIERRAVVWSLVFGLFAGLAVLTKHFSIFLLVALALASLLHPDWKAYYRSPRPWLAAALAVAVVAPNAWWLLSQDFTAITDRVPEFRAQSFGALIRYALGYVGAAIAYTLPGLLLLALVLGPARVMQAWRRAPDSHRRRRAVMVMVLGSLLFPIVGLAAAGIRVHNPWVYPTLSFLPLLLLMTWPIELPWVAVRRILLIVVVYVAGMLALSPAIMAGLFYAGNAHNRDAGVDLAREVTRIWRERTGTPLRIVGGDKKLAFIVAFHSPEHPNAIPFTEPDLPWVDAARIRREGLAIVCENADAKCMRYASTAAPNADTVPVILASRFLGMSWPPVSYTITILRPAT